MSQEVFGERWRNFSNSIPFASNLLRKLPSGILLRMLILLLVLTAAAAIWLLHIVGSAAEQANGATSALELSSAPQQGLDVAVTTETIPQNAGNNLVVGQHDDHPAGQLEKEEGPKSSADAPSKPPQDLPETSKVDNKQAPAPRGGGRATPQGIIVIDPGHGGKDVGANRTFPDGYYLKESDLTLKVSLNLATRLRTDGFQVILTRESDASVNNPPKDRTGDGVISIGDDLQARVDTANDAKANLFVSVHFNSAASSQMGGTEVFYCANHSFSDKSRKMAQLLQTNLINGMRSLGYDSPNRGVKVDTQSAAGTHLYVLGPKTSIIARPITVPSVLGEALFVSNQAEGELLRHENTLNVIAEGYEKSVLQYFDWAGQQ